MLKIKVQRSYCYSCHKLVVLWATVQGHTVLYGAARQPASRIPIVALLHKSKCHIDLTYALWCLLHMHPTRVYLRLGHT